MSAIIDTLFVAQCLCGRAHIVQTGQSSAYFAWHNYISARAPAADTGSSASELVKAIGKSGCTLTPGELSRRMRTGTTQQEVLQWIQDVSGITDRDVLRQFYDLFTAARRPAPHTQVPSVTQKRKHAAAVAELPSDAGSSRSAAHAPEASESASQPAVLQSGSCTSLTHLTRCLVCHEDSNSDEFMDCRFQHLRDVNTGKIPESPRPRGCRAPMSSMRVVDPQAVEHILQHAGQPLLDELERQVELLRGCQPPTAIDRAAAGASRTMCDVCGTSFFTFRCAVPRRPSTVARALERSRRCAVGCAPCAGSKSAWTARARNHSADAFALWYAPTSRRRVPFELLPPSVRTA